MFHEDYFWKKPAIKKFSTLHLSCLWQENWFMHEVRFFFEKISWYPFEYQPTHTFLLIPNLKHESIVSEFEFWVYSLRKGSQN